MYKTWLDQRGTAFKAHVEVATLDPFHGYKNAIDDKLADATAVLDEYLAFPAPTILRLSATSLKDLS